MDEAPLTNPLGNVQGDITSASPVVPVQPPLTPQEIERICKAFIRLITAKETQSNGK